MKIGDLLRYKRNGDIGVVIEVPPPDSYWGTTVVVAWSSGFTEEVTYPNHLLEVLNEDR